jgi:hypothetical protein
MVVTLTMMMMMMAAMVVTTRRYYVLDISLPTLPVYNWRCEARIVNNQRMVEHQPAKKPPQRTQKCVHIHRTARTANIPPTIGVSSSPLI